MKKRNWVIEGLLCSVICFLAFGLYMTQAKGKGLFVLEDIAGDRAALAAFPLAGHGGDQSSSFQFSIRDGACEVQHYSYGVTDLEQLMQAEQSGMPRWMGNFKRAPIESDIWEDTMPVAAEDATVTQENISLLHLFSDGYDGFASDEAGETVTMDAADIFCEIEKWNTLEQKTGFSTGYFMKVRYDTGLTLRDQPYFYTSNGTWTACNYNEFMAGESNNSLKTYQVAMGDNFYAVTAPDERCEGQTYVFRLTPIDGRSLAGHEEVSPKSSAYNRSVFGEAEPIIPIADAAESRVIGLAAIEGQERLLLYRVSGKIFFADLYDTQGKLLGSESLVLEDEMERYQDGVYEYENFSIANEVNTKVVSWEEGASVAISVSGNLEAAENADNFGGIMMTTGRMLLWIEQGGNLEQIPCEQGERAIVRGEHILYLDTQASPEENQIADIMRYGIGGRQVGIRVCDKDSGTLQYQGVLKTDFWQDELENLAAIDTAQKAGYIGERSVYAANMNDCRSLEIYIAGEWRGDR